MLHLAQLPPNLEHRSRAFTSTSEHYQEAQYLMADPFCPFEIEMAVDLFFTNEAGWWNSLVCRTGGRETNIRIGAAAKRLGRQWHVYGEGVTLADGRVIRAESEKHVFELCGVPFLPPEERS